MTDTGRLIDQLAARVEPVRPLASPLRRTLAWSALATVLIGMIVWVYGVRDGLPRTCPGRRCWSSGSPAS